MITNGLVRPLQNRSRQGAPEETPKKRQMLAFIKVGDLLSKPSKTIGVTTNINLNLAEHSVVCKKFLINCVTFLGLLREGSPDSNSK